MNFKKIFSKVVNKEALLIIDVIVCPILAIIFSEPLFSITPKFIFDMDIAEFFLIGCFSIPISIVYFIVLISLKKEKFVKTIIFTLIGVVGSLTVGIFIFYGLTMLLYTLSQMFGLYS